MSNTHATFADESFERFRTNARPPGLPWHRCIVSYCCLLLCILFSALWVLSYELPGRIILQRQLLHWPWRTDACLANAKGYFGAMYFPNEIKGTNLRWQWNKLHDGDLRGIDNEVGMQRIDSMFHSKQGWQIIVPHWPLFLSTLLLAIAIRPKPRWRFGLRDSFVFITSAAAIIGPLAYWLRSVD